MSFFLPLYGLCVYIFWISFSYITSVFGCIFMYGFFFSSCSSYYTHIYMLLLLSRFSRVWLCATPETAAHQAPPSLGFSRQEHWSGLPFPSPVHESEKWKWSHSGCLLESYTVVVWLLATPWTAAYQAPPSMGFSRQEYWSGVPLPSPTHIYTYM